MSLLSQQRSRCFDYDESDPVTRLLEAFLPTASDQRQQQLLPSMRIDLKDTDDAVHVSADLPGVKKEDVQVSFSPDRVLTISAERKTQEEETDSATKSVYKERSFGQIHRSLRLPRTVNTEDATCRFENGVLDIRVGKKDPQTERRYLPIE